MDKGIVAGYVNNEAPGQAVVLGGPMSYRELRPIWTIDMPPPSTRNPRRRKVGRGLVRVTQSGLSRDLRASSRRRRLSYASWGVSPPPISSARSAKNPAQLASSAFQSGPSSEGQQGNAIQTPGS